MPAPFTPRPLEDGTGVQIERPDAPPAAWPLNRLVPGARLRAMERPRVTDVQRQGDGLELLLSDGAALRVEAGRIQPAEGPVDLLVTGIGRLITARPGDGSSPLGEVTGAAVACAAGRVVALGPADAVERSVRLAPGGRRLEVQGRLVTPGLVDPHTHPVFAGDRAREFALRARGATYQEIAAAGGGIRSTMRATREATVETLEADAAARLARLGQRGVTTAEAKSGYDLTEVGELRLLEVIRRLGRVLPMDLSPTLLAAHVVPPEHVDDRRGWIDAITRRLIPAAAAQGLAEAVDVFCDPGAYTLDESRRVLVAARAAGLAVRIHAEQFEDLGSAGMAADLGALSADHLEAVTPDGLRRMARAGTVAVLLPGAALTLRCPWPPRAAIQAAGVDISLGTDLNPGTSMTEDLHLMMSLGCTQMGMTVEDAWLAVTRHAARAAGRPAAGQLAIGGSADLVIWDCEDPATVPYHLGGNHVEEVLFAGMTAWSARGPA